MGRNLDLTEHGLTAKQEKFAQRVARGDTLSNAYRAEYATGNMTGRTVNTLASKLKKVPHILSRIRLLQGQAVDDSSLDSKRVIQELVSLSFSKMDDYGRWDNDSFDLVSSEHLTETQIRAIESIQFDERTVTSAHGDVTKTTKIKFKLYSKLDALDKLAKILRMYQVDGDGRPDPEAHIIVAPIITREALLEASKVLGEIGVAVIDDVPYQVERSIQ